ncbi:MAG: hypothetical protein LQ345_004773 [Seirophora villosa]|nr:MAG: hypothetical protein LQ345_004773 [Seirophora villosa]
MKQSKKRMDGEVNRKSKRAKRKGNERFHGNWQRAFDFVSNRNIVIVPLAGGMVPNQDWTMDTRGNG